MIYIDPTIYTSAPASLDGRLERECAVYPLLERLEIPYLRLEHEQTPTIEDCAAVERLLGVEMCKNLFLCNRQKTQFYLLLMQGHKPFHTKDLSKQLGVSRLSFADPNALEALLHLAPGSVSVLGLMNDHENRVQLVLDRAIYESEEIGCHPCVNTGSMRLRTRDLLERFLPAVGHSPIVVDLPEDEDENS